MKIAKMRRGQALLPHAFVRSGNAQAVEKCGDSEKCSPAVWQIEHQQATRLKSLAASSQCRARIGQMLEDVIERYHVVASSGRQIVRKKADRYIVTFPRSQSADKRIRLNTLDAIASARCRIKKPAVPAAHFEQRSPQWVSHRVDTIKYPLEIIFSQTDESNLPLFLIDDIGDLPVANMWTQVRGEESARRTTETPIVAQRMHVHIAYETRNGPSHVLSESRRQYMR